MIVFTALFMLLASIARVSIGYQCGRLTLFLQVFFGVLLYGMSAFGCIAVFLLIRDSIPTDGPAYFSGLSTFLLLGGTSYLSLKPLDEA